MKYDSQLCKLVSARALTQDVYDFVLECPSLAALARPGQFAQKQRVVPVAAGGVQVGPARFCLRRKHPVAQRHGRKIRHALPPPAPCGPGRKAEFPQQRFAGCIPRGFGPKIGRGLRVKTAGRPQQPLCQETAVPALPPGGVYPQPKPAFQPPAADRLPLFVQNRVRPFAAQFHAAALPLCSVLYHSGRPGGCQALPGGKMARFHICFTGKQNQFHNLRVY